MDVQGYVVAAVALGGLAVSVVSLVSGSRARRDAAELSNAAQDVEEQRLEFEILNGTIMTLRANVTDAQAEADGLRADLATARVDLRRLNVELTVALANVQLLTDHVHEHVPDVPFPKLRRVVTA